MSIHKAYSGATKLPPDVEELPPIEDGVAVQAKVDWLSSTVTKRMMLDLAQESDQLITEAIGLTMTDPQLNHDKITQKLIEANTLRKVMKKYANIQTT